MIESGKLGRKSGSGFYEWDGKKAVRARGNYDQAELAAIASGLLARWSANAEVPLPKASSKADMADAACIFGIGFRPSAAARCSGMKAVLNDRQ